MLIFQMSLHPNYKIICIFYTCTSYIFSPFIYYACALIIAVCLPPLNKFGFGKVMIYMSVKMLCFKPNGKRMNLKQLLGHLKILYPFFS